MAMEHLAPVWTHLTDAVAERAEGIYIYDTQGNQYIDFTSGIGVTNTGHSHPKVVEAVKDAAAKQIFSQINIMRSQATIDLTETLLPLMPEGIDRFFFANSGAEAIEGAVKLAKMATKRTNIITFQGSFHGRTALAMSLTNSKTIYRAGYQPLPSGGFVAPFPYAYRYGMGDDDAVDFCLRELDLIFKSQCAPEETAAIAIEPVLGEGGYVPAPPRFINQLRKICDQYGILLIIDEVQSGAGRTGTWWAHTRSDAKPDIMVMAKGVASGLPISIIASRADLMAHWTPGSHGGTYGGGNPMVMAGARATLEVIRDEGLADNARDVGGYLLESLGDIQSEFPIIGDVRGWGCMVATEFTAPDGAAAGDIAKKVAAEAVKHKLLLLTCGSYGNVIRWIPPLITTRAQVDDALGIFRSALAAHT